MSKNLNTDLLLESKNHSSSGLNDSAKASNTVTEEVEDIKDRDIAEGLVELGQELGAKAVAEGMMEAGAEHIG